MEPFWMWRRYNGVGVTYPIPVLNLLVNVPNLSQAWDGAKPFFPFPLWNTPKTPYPRCLPPHNEEGDCSGGGEATVKEEE